MKRLFLMLMLSLVLVGCDRLDRPAIPIPKDSDNTGVNVRDRDSTTQTPFDQSEKEADRKITQKIRQALTADNSLSTNAKNIKIITINGAVTLRGPVASLLEKDAIIKKVNAVPGIGSVDNQLEVTGNNY